MNSPSLNILNNDSLIVTFQNLNPSSLKQVELTCKRFHTISQQNDYIIWGHHISNQSLPFCPGSIFVERPSNYFTNWRLGALLLNCIKEIVTKGVLDQEKWFYEKSFSDNLHDFGHHLYSEYIERQPEKKIDVESVDFSPVLKKILLENPFFSINTKNRIPEYFKNYNPSEIINWFGGHKDYFKVLSNISMGENFENISVPIKWQNQKLLRFLEKLTPSLKKIIPTLSENLESYLYPFSQLNNEELINHYSRLRNAFKDNLITLSRTHSEDRKKWLFRIDDIEIVFIWYGIGKKNSLKNEFEIIDRIKWISSLGNEIAFTFLCDYFLYRPDVALNNPCQSYLLEEYHKNRNIMALNALDLNKIPPDDFNTLSSYTDLTPCLSLAIQGSISAQDYLCKKCSNSAQMEEYSSILNFLLKSNYT